MKNKKNYIYGLISVALAVASVFTVVSQTKNYSFDRLLKFLREAKPEWLLMAFLCMAMYIFLEGIAILVILKAFGYKRSINKGVVYSASDIFFSAMTPSASGGQPASAFFMNADGIPTGVVTATLILNLVMYNISIMSIGVVAIILRPNMFFHFNGFSKFLILLGYVLLSLLSVSLVLLLKREQVVKKVASKLIVFLAKLHVIKDEELQLKKLDTSIADYGKCSKMIKGHSGMLLRCFVCNFFQRFLQIMIPVIVFISDGGKIMGAINIWVTQVFVTIGSNCVPIPGGMGVSDYLLIDGLRDVMSFEDATNMELTSRGISFYICVLLSIVITVIGYMKVRKKGLSVEGED